MLFRCCLPLHLHLPFTLLCLLMRPLGLNALSLTLKDSNNATCLYAQWKMNFTIEYETANNGLKNVTIQVPSSASFSGSDCGTEENVPQIAVQFGSGFFWSVNFTRAISTYFIDFISFSYDTSDNATFPDAKEKGKIYTAFAVNDIEVPLDQLFKCCSLLMTKEGNVIHSYWDVLVQAFVQKNTISTKEYVCGKDRLLSTVLATTSSPVPLPTAKPIPKEKPHPGTYSVKNGSCICLLATMGLQLNITKNKGTSLKNLNPNTTDYDGVCLKESALLWLNDSNLGFLELLFAIKNGNRFYLKGVNVSLTFVNGSDFVAVNNNLNCWDAPIGSSYMCIKEDSIPVSDTFQINTFDLRVQPFNVVEGKYSTAEDCRADHDRFVVPIAVGTSLGGLVILVLLVYVIGHRCQSVRYEQV
ncbi:lysosome-associated membrane glycoprotein 2 isoform X2 [Monodelphis domestica]|uniref:lysosome-associated membrane glycoprotein 2 isoform X2 n=1 Tax=Monodelphis domestica TaxID=13616 RepID=UPI00028BDE3F|nr:lysosome-associated membrane glycoprotein 2 isoform X2 [Monodelphis domestica]